MFPCQSLYCIIKVVGNYLSYNGCLDAFSLQKLGNTVAKMLTKLLALCTLSVNSNENGVRVSADISSLQHFADDGGNCGVNVNIFKLKSLKYASTVVISGNYLFNGIVFTDGKLNAGVYVDGNHRGDGIRINLHSYNGGKRYNKH